jgi:hypothetical protein
MKKLILIILLVFLSGPLLPRDMEWTRFQTITASNGSNDDNFGFSVNIDGNYAVVGAPDRGSGAAYFFEYDQQSQTWTEVAYVTASDGIGSDRFGYSVAVSGTLAVIGAPEETVNHEQDAGAVYFFERINTGQQSGSWSEIHKATASDFDSNDDFGYSLQISNTMALIGAKNAGFNSFGQVYYFQYDQGSKTWNEIQILTASDRDFNDQFGKDIDFSNNKAVIGADVANAAYFFDYDESSNSWSEISIISNNEAASQFGHSVGISGSYSIIGAVVAGSINGRAYFYDFSQESNTWAYEDEVTDGDASRMGWSSDISGDYSIVGAHQSDFSGGLAFIYQRTDDGTWTQTDELSPNEAGEFGRSVAMNDEFMIIGAPTERSDGAVYFYQINVTPSTPEIYSTSITNITFNSASFSSSLYSGNAEATFSFNYGLNSNDYNDSFTSTTEASTSTVTVSYNATDLLPNSEYFIRFSATNSVSWSEFSEFSFTTSVASPEAYINTVSNIDFESASITADLYNGNTTSSATLELGESSGDYSLISEEFDDSDFAGSTATFSVSQTITGLEPNTQYFYRILHENREDEAQSLEGDFITDAANAEVYLDFVTNITFESASITANLYNGNTTSSATVMYGLNSGNLDEFVPFEGNEFAGSTATFSASQEITGLIPNTEYFYAIRHTNKNNAPITAQSSFTTTPANAEAYTSTVTNITGFSASITFDVYNGNTFSSATLLYGESQNSLTLSNSYEFNPITASTNTITLSQNLINLNPSATYFYVIVNSNSNNSATSSIGTFETGFGNPTILITDVTPSASFVDINFTASNAQQTATITYWITENEGIYDASSSFSFDDNPFLSSSSTQSFEQRISNLGIENEYFYYFEINNGISSQTTTESNFWTLSEEPNHSNTFYQVGEELTSIELGFEPLSESGADGYLILQSTTTPNTYPTNGQAYSLGQNLGNSSITKVITTTSQTSTLMSDLPKEKSYVFTLIPYNWDEENPETYHYNINKPKTIKGFTIPTIGEIGLISFVGIILALGLTRIRKM